MSTKRISVGDEVADFELDDQNGRLFRLKEHLGKYPMVIYFYPKDDTPGCTAEACSFRDQYEDFSDQGVKVIGISSDSIQSHKNFAEKHRLPFTLLSDPEDQVRKKFGVPRSFLGLIPGRVTYVVDREGIIQHVFNSQFRSSRHVQEAIEHIKSLV